MIELRTLSNDPVYPIGIWSWGIASQENNTGSADVKNPLKFLYSILVAT